MLTDSTSLQNDLDKLCSWLELPETKEVKKYLEAQADLADKVVHAGPDYFDSKWDSAKCEIARHQSIGKYRGLQHLFYMLDLRKHELEERIAELKQQHP